MAEQPISRYIVENHILPKVLDDITLSMIAKGKYVDHSAGVKDGDTGSAAKDSMDGFETILVEGKSNPDCKINYYKAAADFTTMTDAEILAYVNGFVDSISGYLDGLLDKLQDFALDMLENLLNQAVDWVKNGISGLLDALQGAVKASLGDLVSKLNDLKESAESFSGYFLKSESRQSTLEMKDAMGQPSGQRVLQFDGK